jgi:hypothetical protein
MLKQCKRISISSKNSVRGSANSAKSADGARRPLLTRLVLRAPSRRRSNWERKIYVSAHYAGWLRSLASPLPRFLKKSADPNSSATWPVARGFSASIPALPGFLQPINFGGRFRVSLGCLQPIAVLSRRLRFSRSALGASDIFLRASAERRRGALSAIRCFAIGLLTVPGACCCPQEQ